MLGQIESTKGGKELDANESEGVSTWVLKSPVKTNSCGVVTAIERKELNYSSRKALLVVVG